MNFLKKIFGGNSSKKNVPEQNQNAIILRSLKESKEKYTKAITYLDSIPNKSLTKVQFIETNQIAGSPLTPQKIEEMWKNGETITIWEGKDGTEVLRTEMRQSFINGISNAESAMKLL